MAAEVSTPLEDLRTQSWATAEAAKHDLFAAVAAAGFCVRPTPSGSLYDNGFRIRVGFCCSSGHNRKRSRKASAINTRQSVASYPSCNWGCALSRSKNGGDWHFHVVRDRDKHNHGLGSIASGSTPTSHRRKQEREALRKALRDGIPTPGLQQLTQNLCKDTQPESENIAQHGMEDASGQGTMSQEYTFREVGEWIFATENGLFVRYNKNTGSFDGTPEEDAQFLLFHWKFPLDDECIKQNTLKYALFKVQNFRAKVVAKHGIASTDSAISFTPADDDNGLAVTPRGGRVNTDTSIDCLQDDEGPLSLEIETPTGSMIRGTGSGRGGRGRGGRGRGGRGRGHGSEQRANGSTDASIDCLQDGEDPSSLETETPTGHKTRGTGRRRGRPRKQGPLVLEQE